MILFPAALKSHAVIGLVCPSSAVTEDEAQRSVTYLENLGYRVKTAENISTCEMGYMAGSGKVRAESLNRMFADPAVDAVFCLRGGDASGRAVPYLDLDTIRQNSKPFVGYSDITTYHLIFNQLLGMGTWHGPMTAADLICDRDTLSRDRLMESLTEDHIEYRNPRPLTVLREGSAEGTLIGGNLSLLCAAMGTPYEPKTDGKILFIEDVHETVNRLDRYLHQLKNAGVFRRCAGLLIGQFTDCPNPDDPSGDAMRCIRESLEGENIPIFADLQTGHDTPNLTLPLGAKCRMDTVGGKLTFELERKKA